MHGHNSFTVCLSNVQQTFTLRWFVYMDCYQSQDSHFTVCALLIASPFLEFLGCTQISSFILKLVWTKLPST